MGIRHPTRLSTGDLGVIVIDSDSYAGATCRKWKDKFPNLAEYGTIILNMTEIKENTLDKSKWIKIQEMLDKSKGEIYFIIDLNSYFPSPLYYPKLVPEKGETITSYYPKFDPYFSIIKPWNFTIDSLYKKTGTKEYTISGYRHICTSIYGKPLAISYRNYYYLPRPSRNSVQEGIEILLYEVLDVQIERTQPPNWFWSFSLPGDQEKLGKIQYIDKEIENLEKEKNELSSELNRSDFLKSILYEKDSPLEKAVIAVFNAMGIDTKNISDEKRADIKIETKNSNIILVEVKGKKKSLAREDLRQLSDCVNVYWQENGQLPKGLMVINPFYRDPPIERNDYYPHDCLKFSKSQNFCIMTTIDLYFLLKEYLEGKITAEEVEEAIVKTIGPFSLSSIVTE
ncbi:MAG: hypothetical protein ACFFD4_08260 [Candidatus Odinarchaeota archaeon]